MADFEIERTPFDVDIEDDSGQEYPWAPQPGETSLGFHYFTIYRNLGPKRTIAMAAREVGRDSTTLRELSKKFSWVDRTMSFDAWLDRRSVEDLARGRTQMRQEHADLAVLARQKIATRLKTLDPDEMSARDLATWADLAVKIERQARGEPDKVTRIEGEVSIIETLDAQQRRQMMEAAMNVLRERLGHDETGELEEAIAEAELVEDDGGQGS